MRQLLFATLLSLIASSVTAQDCVINELIAEAHPCINGTFLVDIDFFTTNPDTNEFGIVGNATDYGFFFYGDLPVTIGPLAGDGNTEWEFIVYDKDDPECQATIVLGIITCCEIFDVVVDPQDCENSETFSAIVNFNFTNTGDVGFDVFDGEENFLGFFSYDDLPVTVTGIPSGGIGQDVIVICDNDDSNCCTTVDIEGPDCDPTNCEIYNVDVVAGDCANGEFFVTLGFSFENVGPQFSVLGNGNDYGDFSYDSLPITIGPLLGDSVTIYEFVVIDSQTDGCEDFAVLLAPDCPESCGFNDVVVDPIECQGDSNYSVLIDFIPISVGDQGFTVEASGEELGEFQYSDLPVTIQNFPASGDFFDALTLCDVADTSCCETYEFQALLCGDCIIYNLVVETTECDSSDQFQVVLTFEYQNVGNSGFQIGGNGNNYGDFDYEDLPITLGPFDGNNVTFYEFVVFDNENGLCIEGTELGLVNCINPCEIGELNVDPLECTGDGTYNLFLDFDYANTDTLGFDVWAGDDFIGFFSYSDLPLTIDDFPASGNDFDQITVCDNDNAECCSSADFLSLDCFEVCEIWDIVVDPIECTSDSTFSAIVTFFYENLDNEFVDIWSGDIFLGFYAVDSLPVLVDGFPSSFGNIPITICENDNELCCAEWEFQALQCDSSCAIFDIVVDLDDCNDDGTFDMLVNFSTEGLTSVNVNISNNGELIGVFPADDVPILLEGIPGTGGVSVLTICDNDNDECCGDIEYEVPSCEIDSCNIIDIVLDDIACNDDGTFSMQVYFEADGLSSSFVSITNNDIDLGVFPVDSVPLFLEGLPGTGENALLTICDNDNDECCASIEYETPECNVSCEIFDIILDGIECEGDGTFSMYILFESQGLQNDFVDISFNGDFIGFFPVDSVPIFVDGLPGTGNEAQLTICENDNDDCCTDFFFVTPDCEGCSISELVVDPAECTSDTTFGAWISFDHTGIDSNTVDIYSDGQFIGTFPTVTPLFVGNLPAGDENIVVEVCGNDTTMSPACCATAEVEALNCIELGCPIVDVVVTTSECDSSGQFFVTLDVNLEGEAGGGFIVAGNGTTYGSFGYNDLPITLGPLDGDGETEWEFIVIDLGEPSCSAFTELGVISCDPSGLFGPRTKVLELEIRYREGHPFFFVPESDLTMYIWDTQGRLHASSSDISVDEVIELEYYTEQGGVLIVQLRGENRVYIAKAVLLIDN
jgi:hypothetical protein